MKTSIQQALDLLGEQQPLPPNMMRTVMHQIMDGKATDAQIGGLLMALKLQGETTQYITEAAEVMRERAIKVEIDDTNLIDTCGTGGDGKSLFNVSTASAFIAAAAGCKVAKHGNRSVSSSTGSADVLEAAGIHLDLSPEQVKTCIENCGIGFLFAPAHHGATRYAVGPRKELAVRTMFNLLGPLTNPANTPYQVMGIYAAEWMLKVAEVLKQLGAKHVMVVHSTDGMDEISLAAPTHVVELKNGSISEYTIQPEDFAIASQSMDELVVKNANQSFDIIEAALTGQSGPAADILALNAGAAIYVAQKAPTLAEGIVKAREILNNGAAYKVLQQLKTQTQDMRHD
ncbi:anthranilate phosphoribosyltransferase [Marinicella sp. W31]|uniref:anthranilate phosphoribosyltransferase n=1 Tax=Marinicella sp. W31 TaxID=3023713 RepID=UPI003756E9A2